MAILKDLLVNGNSSLLGTTTAVNILPQTDATYDLGSSGFGWKTIYLDKASDNDAHHQGISFLNDTNEVAHIGTDGIGIGIYGDSKVYIRPSLTATNQGFTVTSTAIIPAANGTIDLGYHNTTDSTDLFRWKTLYLKANSSTPGIDYLMDDNSSASRYIVNIKNTSNQYIGGIGFWNTGDTDGVIYLIPHTHSGVNGYGGTVGLWIGKNNLKWENKYLLRYSATATTNLLIIADGTVGNVKTSGTTITTTAPSSNSADTTIPTSKAVWSAASTAANAIVTNKVELDVSINSADNVWRKVLLNGGSGDTYSNWNTMAVTKTDIVYQSTNVAVLPGTGLLRATKLLAGTIIIGDTTISGLVGKSITATDTLYINRNTQDSTTNSSIIFLQHGVSYIQIDVNNNLIPVTSQTGNLNLGLNANRWKMVYTNGVKIGNNTVVTNTDGCIMQYDENLQTLKFVFA